jgi:hypothetical protein
MDARFIRTLLSLILALIALPWTHTAQAASNLKNTNVTVEPLGVFFGFNNAQVNFRLGDRFAIGPTLGFGSISSDSNTANLISGGIDAEIALNSPIFTNGLILNPSLTLISASWTSNTTTLLPGGGTSRSTRSEVSVGLGLGLDFGYHWFFDSGLNLLMGAGISIGAPNLSSIGVGSRTNLVLGHLGVGLGIAF